METVTKDDLMALGYRKYTAQGIIREAKMTMVQKGYPLYLNRRIGVVPKEAVESIIGGKITKEESESVGKNGRNL
ncbi:DUF3173 domain-containing protein [Tetragenococcus halophilus]